MYGGLRHSSMTVQMENEGAKSKPLTTRFAPSRTPSSSIELNKWSDAKRAKTSTSPGSTPMHTSASLPFFSHSPASANCSSPSSAPTSSYGWSGCDLESDIAVSM
eukprot:Amastigsp_a176886_29.p5 type:complete len:105 gc:universal Amastigsp_a176886_29:791-1105(+)